MVTKFILPLDLRAQIAAEARATYPRECCGLIEGVRESNQVRAMVLHPTANFAPEADRFEIDPVAHLRLLRALRGTECEIVGCYHSHPNGRLEPSERDGEGMRDDGFVWVIAAIAGVGEPAAFSAFLGRSFHGVPLAE
jgi:proteasome lid subunit RPN8/RPN11